MRKLLIAIVLLSGSASFSANAGVWDDLVSLLGFNSEQVEVRASRPGSPGEW